jgi:biotin operon repressor
MGDSAADVLDCLKTGEYVSGAAIGKALGITRNAVNKHIRSLCDLGWNIERVPRRGTMLMDHKPQDAPDSPPAPAPATTELDPEQPATTAPESPPMAPPAPAPGAGDEYQVPSGDLLADAVLDCQPRMRGFAGIDLGSYILPLPDRELRVLNDLAAMTDDERDRTLQFAVARWWPFPSTKEAP